MVYTAPDGTTFEDRSQYRKYVMETCYTFRERTGEVLRKEPGAIDGQPFELADLRECEVLLLDHTDQVTADALTGCKVFIGACAESLFVRDSSDCEFTVACKQLRTRDCHRCTFHLYCKTEPIIETSDAMRFAPFNGAYPELAQHMSTAGLDPNVNPWHKIYDFNDPDRSGKNWQLVADADPNDVWAPLGEASCPVPWVLPAQTPKAQQQQPTDGGPTLPEPDVSFTDGAMGATITFSFDTSQEDAQAAMNGVLPPPAFGGVGPTDPGTGGGLLGGGGGYQQDLFTDAAAAPTPAPAAAWGAQAQSGGERDGGASFEDPAEKANRDFEARVAARREDEKKRTLKARAESEKVLDRFYDDRTDVMAHRQSLNREREDAFRQRQEELESVAEHNPWERVCDLVDLKAYTESDGTQYTGVDRMRSLLIQLKAERAQRS